MHGLLGRMAGSSPWDHLGVCACLCCCCCLFVRLFVLFLLCLLCIFMGEVVGWEGAVPRIRSSQYGTIHINH